MIISLDPVKFDDRAHLRWWYDIRNAEPTRRHCRSLKKITVDEHYVWWHESKISKTRRLFFIRRQSGGEQPEVVGIGRVDHRKSWSEIALAVVPEWRGRGIGLTTVKHLAVQIGLWKWPPPGAIVSGQNASSLSVFLKAGFLVKRKGFIQLTMPMKGRR